VHRPNAVVTVAVISWNTRELLVRCLSSLAADARDGRADVWVVDNASSDGSADAARAAAPWAHVVQAGENLGFGRAVNLVARQTSGDWIACANADVALVTGALERLVQVGRSDPLAGAVAPRLVLPDGRTQHSVYPFPTIGFTLGFNLGAQRLSARLADRWCLEGAWNAERVRTVPWAIGALLLLRRRAFDDVGGFDERQWVYAEDLDLGWRLHDAGWSTRYEPSARVFHADGAATGLAFGGDRTSRYMRATYEVIERRSGRRRARAIAAVNVAGAAARVVWMAPLAMVLRRWRDPLARTRAWRRVHLEGWRGVSPGPRRG
jgi:N-acetylglucosaminyl-diphospho-decaprenol L-rhamnosyltransferase